MTYIYILKALYMHMYPFTQTELHIYMQCDTLKLHVQATGAARSCSQHSIMI